MIDKTSFTADEWSKVRSSVLGAGMAVSLAEPSGLIGMLQEGFANAKTLVNAKQDAEANALVKAVVADIGTSEGRTAARDDMAALVKGKEPADMRATLLALLTEVGRIVEAKAPAEAPGFKAWLRDNSRKVAEAASEGGFLGFGGTQVTDNERATLQHIDRALG